MFDILCYDGAVKKLLPGQFIWPVKKPITTRP